MEMITKITPSTIDEFLENMDGVDRLRVVTNLLLFNKYEMELYYLEFAPSEYLQMFYKYKGRILDELHINSTSGSLFFISKEGVTL
jgi:hypothetical protein